MCVYIRGWRKDCRQRQRRSPRLQKEGKGSVTVPTAAFLVRSVTAASTNLELWELLMAEQVT